jgi:phosphate transport system permease protein
LSRSQVVWSVVLPQSATGLISGSFLGLARAAGETAPIMFTAAVFSGASLPQGIRESPVVALPYHIFVLAQDSFQPGAEEHMWGATFVLLILVLGLSLVALPARLAVHEESKHG